MGASGAGKTTLLETISGRKTTGQVEGSLLVDGRPVDSSFSRQAGFAMQADIHEPLSTVRECLQFSAILRQDNQRSREERVQFAENIIRLLELETIADALIGTPGSDGLNVEERKRVTIGVELAADPAFVSSGEYAYSRYRLLISMCFSVALPGRANFRARQSSLVRDCAIFEKSKP